MLSPEHSNRKRYISEICDRSSSQTGGEFCTGDYEEIINKASCLSLLSNVVLVWNTLAIEKIVTQLRTAGEEVPEADLARIFLLLYQHVIPNGTYRFPAPKLGVNIVYNTLE